MVVRWKKIIGIKINYYKKLSCDYRIFDDWNCLIYLFRNVWLILVYCYKDCFICFIYIVDEVLLWKF